MSICILDSRGKRATTAGLCRLVFDYDIIAVLLLHVRARTVHVDRSVLLTGDQRKCDLRELTTTLHNGYVGTGRGFMITHSIHPGKQRTFLPHTGILQRCHDR